MSGLPFPLPSGLPTSEEVAGGAVRTVTDSVGVVDDTSRIHDAKRTPIETVGIADSVEGAAGGAVRTVTDSVGVADVTSRIHDAKRTPIEAVGIADSTDSASAAVRIVTDSVSVADGTSRIYAVTVTDSVGVADGTSRSKRTSISVNMSLDIAVSSTLLQVGVIPIYATSGVGGGAAGRSPGGNRNRRLPKSRLVRR